MEHDNLLLFNEADWLLLPFTEQQPYRENLEDFDEQDDLQGLPEIEVSSHDDSLLLEPIDNLDQVFDNDPIITQGDAIDILQQLDQLNLTDQDEEHIDDNLPSFLYCQPCTQDEIGLADNIYCQPCTTTIDTDDLDQNWLDNPELVEDIQNLLSELTLEPGLNMNAPLNAASEHASSKPPTDAARPFLRMSPPRDCLGHRERILGMHMSECGKYIATASQDATVRVWNVQNHKQISVLNFDKNYECLRVSWASPVWGNDRTDRCDETSYILAVGTANGLVSLWGCKDPTQYDWKELASLDHSTFHHFVAQEQEDTPQVYALQLVDHWRALPNQDDQSNSFLLTSSDDHIHLWEIDGSKKSRSETGSSNRTLSLREVMSLRFEDMHQEGYGVHVCRVTGEGMNL